MTGKPEPTDETLALGGPPGVDQPNLLLDWAIWAFLYPLQLALRALGLVFDLVRPYAPQLVPLVFCLLLLPVLAFFSLSAGFVVWKTSAVSWEYPVLLQYGDGVPPYADVALEVAAMQQYDIALHLSVPAVESNYALGNFMASLTLATPSNTTIVSVRRPAIILPPGSALLTLRKTKRVIDYDIPLLSGYAIRSGNVVAHIELGRRDHWKSIGNGEGRELTVLSASLQGALRHRGVRGAFTRFPLFTAGVASTAFFIITAAVVGACLLTATRLHATYDASEAPPADGGEEEFPEEVTQKIVRRRGSLSEKPLKRRDSSRRNSREVKIEPEASDVPLRRRVSRPSARADDFGT